MNKRTKKLLAMMAAPPRLRRVSGLPPLSYTTKKAGTLTNYRIYGQTSRNLFDGELTDYYHLDATTGLPVGHDHRFATLQPITINQGEYCLTYNSTTDLRFMYSVFNNDTLIRRVAIINDRFLRSGDAIDTTGGNKIYFAFYNNDHSHASTGMISNIMLNSGEEPLPYEPYGESVGDRTGNILPMSTVPISTDIDDFHCEYDGMGTITLTATKDNADFSSFTIPLKEDFIIPISVGQGGNGCLQFNNDKAYLNNNIAVFLLCFNFNNTRIDGWSLLEVNCIVYSYIGMGGRTINNISIEKQEPVVLHLAKGDKLTIQPAFYNNGTTEQVPFEPYGYKVPVTVSNGTDTLTTPIYLPEQIKKVGDEAEYIDYGEQKFHRISGADLDVTLPALPTLTGTNVLSVGTEVQPSLVEVTGRIRPVPTGGGE